MKRSKIIGSAVATIGISMAGLLSGIQPAGADSGPIHCISTAGQVYCSENYFGGVSARWYYNGYLQSQFNNQSSAEFACVGNFAYYVLLSFANQPGYYRFDGPCVQADN